MASACPITRLDEKKGKICHVRVSDLLHIYFSCLVLLHLE